MSVSATTLYNRQAQRHKIRWANRRGLCPNWLTLCLSFNAGFDKHCYRRNAVGVDSLILAGQLPARLRLDYFFLALLRSVTSLITSSDTFLGQGR